MKLDEMEDPSQAWWCTAVIPGIRRQRQEDCKFKDYISETQSQKTNLKNGDWG
jgi:hypothetical protein